MSKLRGEENVINDFRNDVGRGIVGVGCACSEQQKLELSAFDSNKDGTPKTCKLCGEIEKILQTTSGTTCEGGIVGGSTLLFEVQ